MDDEDGVWHSVEFYPALNKIYSAEYAEGWVELENSILNEETGYRKTNTLRSLSLGPCFEFLFLCLI